jgi:amino acid transporter
MSSQVHSQDEERELPLRLVRGLGRADGLRARVHRAQPRLAPILSERLGLSLGKTSILVVVVVLILSQFLINLAGVRIASRTNNVAAFTAELAASIILTLILLVVGLSGGALVFEWVAMIALFAGGLANMAAASRLAFSLSRDRMLPGSRRLAQVSPATSSPVGSLVAVTAFSLLLVTVGTYIATEAMTLIRP